MQVDRAENMLYLGCKNKNVYCFSLDHSLDSQSSKKFTKAIGNHRYEITTMSLTKNERYLVVGTTDGVLYIHDLEATDKFTTLELHKDKGEI